MGTKRTNPRSTAPFAVLFIVTITTLAANGASLTVVHDQSGLTAVNGKAAQKFESTRSARDSEGTDDFTVGGTDPVIIRQIQVQGRYSTASVAVTTVLVSILADSGGPGAAICTTTGAVVTDTSGDLTVDLQAGCLVTPGTYWLAVQADLSWDPGGQWFWDSSATEVGAHAMWRNQGGGFPTQCSSFGTLPDCFGSAEVSYIFSVSASPVLIFQDGFESGNTGAWSSSLP